MLPSPVFGSITFELIKTIRHPFWIFTLTGCIRNTVPLQSYEGRITGRVKISAFLFEKRWRK
jgi:hypothetical protein